MMIDEKEILFQIIGREIDNLTLRLGPVVNMFSGSVKNYVFDFLSPYVDAFTNPKTNRINTEAAREFTKQEINLKVNDFLDKFEERRNKDDIVV